MFLTFLSKFKDFGILLTRIGIGFMFFYGHGYAKMFGGPERWAKVGGAMKHVGLDFAPAAWGFMAAFSEFFGGILFLLGLFFRPATALLLITMIVAANMHIATGDGLRGASHAIENALFLITMLVIGPGKYSIDAKMGKAS